MAIALAIIIALAVLIYVFIRMGKQRPVDDQQPSPKRTGRRQRKLEKIREFDPLPEPKSIFDLMNEEAEELGVDQAEGSERLEIPVKLKVWKRDHSAHASCSGRLRYQVDDGIEPAGATEDDVRLTCDQHADHPATEEVAVGGSGDPGGGDAGGRTEAEASVEAPADTQ